MTYTVWIFHGELFPPKQVVTGETNEAENNKSESDDDDEVIDMLHDLGGMANAVGTPSFVGEHDASSADIQLVIDLGDLENNHFVRTNVLAEVVDVDKLNDYVDEEEDLEFVVDHDEEEIELMSDESEERINLE
ncbi:hypothetical protein Fot_22396 [Forsythia ovata]|uniref:Transposase n=1 Tax=Forsythia ovata TaxID=205694 RepID=A0ABD1UXM2_9LAMI